jgi:hypothetical protein
MPKELPILPAGLIFSGSGDQSNGVTGIIKSRSDGSIFHYKAGKLHRTDGPAIMYDDGFKLWFLYGKNCTEEMHKKLTQSPNSELLLLMGQGFDEYIETRLKGEG